MKGRHRTGGFTLLELLMVVIIIAILASIALPQYLRVSERSRTTEALTLMATIRSSEGRFRAEDPSNLYSQDLGVLDVDLPGVAPGDVTLVTPSWSIAVSGTGVGENVQATRLGVGLTGASIIYMDLDTGTTCADAPANVTWGLPPPGPGC